MQDETYTGTLVQGRKGSQHFKLKEMESRPSSEWIRVENAHEAIIDRNDFDLVQRIRNLDTRTSPQKDKVYLFSGILVCGCCGSRMIRKTNRYKDKEYHYLVQHYGIYDEGDHYRTSFYDGWITDRGWTDYGGSLW